MEIKNKYILFATGVALIVGSYFHTGIPSANLGFVPVTDYWSLGEDVLVAFNYIVGIWIIYFVVARMSHHRKG